MEILVDGCTLKLVIQQVALEDEGTYSVTVGEHTSTARLMVEGELGMGEEEQEEKEEQERQVLQDAVDEQKEMEEKEERMMKRPWGGR